MGNEMSAGEAYVSITAKTESLKDGIQHSQAYCKQLNEYFQSLERKIEKTDEEIQAVATSTDSLWKKMGKGIVFVFEKIDGVEKKLQQADEKITGYLAKQGKAILSHAATIVAATGPFTQIGDKFNKMAERTGMTTEYLTRMSHAANLCGSSIETVEGATKGLQAKLLDAANGSQEAAKMFTVLGLSAAEVSAMTPERQLDAVISGLGTISDSSERAAVAAKLLGDAGVALMPMINAGSDSLEKMRAEADELGITMSGESCQSAGTLAKRREQY